MPKMGCQRANDRKSYRFLFGTFFDRGVHFEKQRRYEKNGTLTVREIALPCGWQISCTMLISFIMYRVQVQLSRKHKYHNYSTKKEGLQPRHNISQQQPLKATPHKARLSAMRSICWRIFRHITQKLLAIRQYSCAVSMQADEKSVGTSTTHSLCGVACAERDFQPAACRCQPEHLPVGVENTVADDTAEILGEVLRGIGPVKTFWIEKELLAFANAAAAIITTRRGALKVMPEKKEILDLLRR